MNTMMVNPEAVYQAGYAAFSQGNYAKARLLASQCLAVASHDSYWRFGALGLCLYQFLDEVRAVHQRLWGEHLSLGQARQQIRNSHQEALLDWVFDQVQAGASRHEIRLALQPAMQL